MNSGKNRISEARFQTFFEGFKKLQKIPDDKPDARCPDETTARSMVAANSSGGNGGKRYFIAGRFQNAGLICRPNFRNRNF